MARSPSRAPLPGARRAASSWVPIRSLGPGDRPRMVEHLLALPPQDRYLRFGHLVGDARIEAYVAGIDFERDEVFGIFNRRLVLIALAHLAYEPGSPIEGQAAMAEFGVSVLPRSRRRGFGARLFQHAITHARNRGIDKLFIQALSDNTAMLEIARKAGASVKHQDGESQAWLQLPPDTLASQLEQFVDTQSAELDFRLKQRALRIEFLLDAWEDLRRRLTQSGGSSSQ